MVVSESDTAPLGIRFVAPDLDLDLQNKNSTSAIALYEPDGEQIKDIPEIEVSDVAEGSGIVYEESLESLRDAANRDERIDLTGYVTPERYRFIDCRSFARDNVLRLWEMEDLPTERYVAISHVWKSLPPEENDTFIARGTFLVECEDRNDGGPISIDVLYWTALATLRMGVRLLWLDRLCILQTPTEAGNRDKAWQIKKMYGVYKCCIACIILPAGLRRFTMKMEDTPWMTRAWTFQEVMVPPIVEVLFTTRLGMPPGQVVHRMDAVQYFTMVNQSVYDDDRDGSAATREQFAQALRMRDHFVQMSNNSDVGRGSIGQFYDIWKFIQWRVSARPVDVVFSAMGLLGINLDPCYFSREDRFGATLAMAQQLLCKDSSKNTCIEVPLWRWMPKNRWTAVGELPTGYMAKLPIRVRLQDLEEELSSQVIHRFRSATTNCIASRGNLEDTRWGESSISDQSISRNLVIMGRGVEAGDAIRDWLNTNAPVATKVSQLAGRMVSEIPIALLKKVYEVQGHERILITSSENVVLELCHELCGRANLGTPPPSASRYVYGWCIRSILWVKLGRYPEGDDERFPTESRKRYGSVAVPVLTLWKFEVPVCDTSDS
ncbi:hypothetical protein QCA50_004943 [Cerrena zonata]|uniref:Heterokaryon incompatibility domain-containing protein n=1 Tax=Cerrena zonata TaxID=2478898 RepID=A0AAW0GIC5_9APHY